MQRGGWELLASRHLMFVTAVWSANISHLFTFGSLKIETFLVSVLGDRAPNGIASAHLNLLLFSLLFSVASCHGKELFVVYHPSLCC